MQAQLLAIPPEHDPGRLRKFEADFTPTGVVRQLFVEAGLAELYPGKHVRVLCPSAGAGVYPMVAREAFGDRAHITAVEIRPEERVHLERWADEVHIGDIRDVAPRLGEYDLIVDNPPFKELFEVLPTMLWSHLRCHDEMHGRLVLLGLSQWGQSARAHKLREKLEHVLQVVSQFRVGGRPAFRTGGDTDSREYSHFVWAASDEKSKAKSWHRWEPLMWGYGPHFWMTQQLEQLPVGQRIWKRRPGTETKP